MIDSADDAAVAAVKLSSPPICDECELPQEEITHSYVYEWACATDSCAKRFHPSFEGLIFPHVVTTHHHGPARLLALPSAPRDDANGQHHAFRAWKPGL
ncbi:hypothetical protein [Cryobacterium gelidum]|uniref:Uncharacterized protein n=1 Tax=Cryobacterium gelidum TaxID=1259164 RepID=A0A4R9AZ74_9MICO|nr:hypothetical protein [Cryobacterium gelidum]TFD72102.1 hypothetical protein E3T50_06305 [Cryobacterium gelidum]